VVTNGVSRFFTTDFFKIEGKSQLMVGFLGER
jgi:hypothetical protein